MNFHGILVEIYWNFAEFFMKLWENSFNKSKYFLQISKNASQFFIYSPPFLLTFLIITSTKHFIFTFDSTHVSKLLFPLYSEVLLMYSMTLSSSKYFTESPRLMKRRASVDETSLATQFVTMWIFRRYLLRRSESKMNCSGLLPLRVMTTSPCWPRIDSSWSESLRFIFGKLNKFISNFH